ncbi:hypothetical protein CEUSTIGMA_g8255.t1 [Chlamydomonas eustigma]|uniref:SAP domain-containing protein n=1 Tax=Chlamydomonas eustigma TaxID=1157962 RepID=A0A250XDI0_9CHLO|nr:hypothetical protein CEUSTIGMA_g8255.t1 [Chlamydomonas eustigma]|eukprot:GAX80820.1 hypothetical protein CEUSTIGMA_g8255.t1 [Chlamydomonas eustigma]
MLQSLVNRRPVQTPSSHNVSSRTSIHLRQTSDGCMSFISKAACHARVPTDESAILGTHAHDVEGLRKLRVVDLQAQLVSLGLPKSGLKEQLIQRIIDAGRGPPASRSSLEQSLMTADKDAVEPCPEPSSSYADDMVHKENVFGRNKEKEESNATATPKQKEIKSKLQKLLKKGAAKQPHLIQYEPEPTNAQSQLHLTPNVTLQGGASTSVHEASPRAVMPQYNYQEPTRQQGPFTDLQRDTRDSTAGSPNDAYGMDYLPGPSGRRAESSGSPYQLSRGRESALSQKGGGLSKSSAPASRFEPRSDEMSSFSNRQGDLQSLRERNRSSYDSIGGKRRGGGGRGDVQNFVHRLGQAFGTDSPEEGASNERISAKPSSLPRDGSAIRALSHDAGRRHSSNLQTEAGHISKISNGKDEPRIHSNPNISKVPGWGGGNREAVKPSTRPQIVPPRCATAADVQHPSSPQSSHPQEKRGRSWAGHRPPVFFSQGLAQGALPTRVNDEDAHWNILGAPVMQALDSDIERLTTPGVQMQRSSVASSGSSLIRITQPAIRVDHSGHKVEEVDIATCEDLLRKQHLPELPETPKLYRGESYGSDQLDLVWEDKQWFINSNPTALLLTILGTSMFQASKHRAQPSVVLMRAKDVIIFDAGDDTQRQFSRMEHVRASKVHRIFVTSMTADCVAGLPGLLCTISASRESGHEAADIPVHLYGPPGLAEYISMVLKISNTYLEISIIIHEFSMQPIPPESQTPVVVNERARIFRSMMPPDQLNPLGCIDGDISTFMPTRGRAVKSKGVKASGGVLGMDVRMGYLPFPENSPGDPTRRDLSPMALRWSIKLDSAGMITAIPVRSHRPTLAYVFHEPDRSGTLLLDRVEALGVPKGASLGFLKDGRSIVTAEGRLVTPDMVLTEVKPGRKILVMGMCSSCDTLVWHEATHGVDVLIAGGTISSDVAAAVPSVGSQLLAASALGKTAAQIQARHVLLSRFDWRVHGKHVHPYEDPVVKRLVLEVARELEPQHRVTAIHDFWVHVMEKHEGRDWKAD